MLDPRAGPEKVAPRKEAQVFGLLQRETSDPSGAATADLVCGGGAP
jgi:hypothetical protein